MRSAPIAHALKAAGLHGAGGSAGAPSDATFSIAAKFVRDALAGRSPNTRLAAAAGLSGAAAAAHEQPREAGGCCRNLRRGRLQLEDVVLSTWWKWLLQLVVLMHCVLTVWENVPPSINTPPFAWWTGVVEVIFLCVYAVDQVIVFRVFGLHHYMDKKWEACFALVMGLAWLDWLLYYPIGLRAIFRFARPLRPLLGIAKRKALRRLTASVLRTVPHMLDIAMLLFIAVMFFGVVGLQLFNDEQVPGYDPNNDNFNNWADSALAIFILASTENYPNVANLSYKHRPVAAGIFFVTALFVLLWIITPLILAIVYDHFKEVRGACVRARRVCKTCVTQLRRELSARLRRLMQCAGTVAACVAAAGIAAGG